MKHERIIATISLLLVSLLAPLLTVSAQSTAIRAGHVIDVATGTVLANQIILIEDGVITSIGADVRVPSGATEIDLSNQYVMPGLIDAHTHLTMTTMEGADVNDFGSYYYTGLIETTAFRALQGAAQARSMLETGFTWVRDVGNNALYADVEVRRAIEGGWIPGPNVIASGRIISPFGGQFQMQPEKPGLGNPEYFYADSEEEIRKAIRENIHYGATVIKLVTDNQPYYYSVEDVAAAVDEAGDVGVKVAAHAYADEAIRNAVLGGVSSIEHGNNPSDETLTLMKERGVYLVGTDFPASATSPAAFERILARNRRALAAGTPMAFGSDVVYARDGWTRGELTLEFLDSFTGADFPATLILQMFTMNAADLLDVNAGQIKVGLAADIIAMDENPLDDVTALRGVQFVMKDGNVYKRNGTFEWKDPRHMNNPRRKMRRKAKE